MCLLYIYYHENMWGFQQNPKFSCNFFFFVSGDSWELFLSHSVRLLLFLATGNFCQSLSQGSWQAAQTALGSLWSWLWPTHTIQTVCLFSSSYCTVAYVWTYLISPSTSTGGSWKDPSTQGPVTWHLGLGQEARLSIWDYILICRWQRWQR